MLEDPHGRQAGDRTGNLQIGLIMAREQWYEGTR
jgi:hypothetical protein